MSYVMLLLFFVVEYVRPISYMPGLMVLKMNSLVPLAALVGTFTSGTAATSKDWVGSDPATKVVLGLLGLITVSVLTADVQMFAMDRFTAVLGFALIFWVITSEATTIPRIQGVFAALVAVHVIVAALNPVLFTDPDKRNYIASGSFLGDGNDFALSTGIAVPLCLFLFLNAKVWLRPVWAMGLLVMVACIVLSQSRGGTIGLGAMGLYYWFKSPKKVQTGLVAAVLIVLITVLAPGAYFTRMKLITDTNEGSASARMAAWKVAVRMAADNPLLGVGAGNFPTKFAVEYHPKDYEGPNMTAHSVYFLALGELGVPGFLMLFYLVIANLRANQRLAAEVKNRYGPKAIEMQLLASTSASIIAFATAGAFLSCLYYPHIYVICGIQAAARKVVRDRCVERGTVTPAVKHREISIHPMLRPPAPRPLITSGRRL